MSILETRDIHHDFQGLAVLFGIDLAVEEGERRAIIGPNGAGKTTLFNMITGKYIPKKGSVFLDGREVTKRPVFWRARHGLARSFQITNIFPRLTVFESLRAAVLSRRSIRLNMYRAVAGMAAVSDEVDGLLGRIGLEEQREVPGGLLAYGQQRALEIGLTLALKPRVILLDEPTAGMSSEETRYMVELIKRLTEGMSLIIIEHDMDVVFGLADTITVLHYGEVLASGPKGEIKQDPKVKEAYLGEED
jgi:branched-chain amino acid transport system ATP-binding protein